MLNIKETTIEDLLQTAGAFADQREYLLHERAHGSRETIYRSITRDDDKAREQAKDARATWEAKVTELSALERQYEPLKLNLWALESAAAQGDRNARERLAEADGCKAKIAALTKEVDGMPEHVERLDARAGAWDALRRVADTLFHQIAPTDDILHLLPASLRESVLRKREQEAAEQARQKAEREATQREWEAGAKEREAQEAEERARIETATIPDLCAMLFNGSTLENVLDAVRGEGNRDAGLLALDDALGRTLKHDPKRRAFERIVESLPRNVGPTRASIPNIVAHLMGGVRSPQWWPGQSPYEQGGVYYSR